MHRDGYLIIAFVLLSRKGRRGWLLVVVYQTQYDIRCIAAVVAACRIRASTLMTV